MGIVLLKSVCVKATIDCLWNKPYELILYGSTNPTVMCWVIIVFN